MRRHTGALVGSVFGYVYVMVNAGLLGSPWAGTLRGLATAAVVLVFVLAFSDRSPEEPVAGRGFTRSYWLVVLAEVAAVVVGGLLLSGPLDTPDAGIAWVTTVVGVHFVALAVVWSEPALHRVGGALGLLGVAGLVLAFSGADVAAVRTVAGVVPGFVLLLGGLWAVRQAAGRPRARAGT